MTNVILEMLDGFFSMSPDVLLFKGGKVVFL